jgi:hypothetical protein
MKPRVFRTMRLAAVLLPVLFIFSFPPPLSAQESRGKITGTVTDPNKAAVPGATVTITDAARGTSVTLTTNGEGFFQAPYLLPGTYQVVVEVAGFKRFIQDNVVLQISETRDLSITLEVGGTQETVTVTAGAADLNNADANLGQTVDSKRIAELPLVHGDPYTLVGLSPGVTYTGSTRLDRPFEPTHIVGYAMDGVRGIRSDLLIDGAPSTATANGNEVIASYVPPSDITQEFKVQTATFDAQFGNTEGGVTSILIKSGTNDFHGTAYLWTEPGGMAANDFFGNSRGQGRPFTYSNRPGFSIGGPVWLPKLYNGKNKTFFLFGYEGIRDSRPRFDANANVYVPTDALKNGDFSGLGVTIYDPLTGIVGTGTGSGGNGCAAGVVCRTAFAGNKIPAGRISPQAQAILKYFGSPKNPGLLGNIFDSQLTERTKPYDNFTVRIDQNIGEKNKGYVRYSWYNRSSFYNNYTGTPYVGVNFIFIAKQAVADLVHTFNSTTVLDMKYGYNRFIRGQDQRPDARGFDLTQLGFPSSYNSLIPESTRRFPRFDFPSNTVLGNGMSNEFRPVDSHFVSATLNKAHDKHSLKYGGEMRIYREDDSFQSNDQTGQFVFDNTYTRPTSASSSDTNGLQAFAAFLLGYPTTLNIVRRADYSEYSKTWGFFAQDDWRVSNKLTLNLGLRYEFETPLTERQNKSVSGFDTTYVQPVQAAAQAKYAALNDPTLKALLPQITATGGLLFAGKDTGSGLYRAPKNGLLPRAGFAYQWNDKTVIRGGFGLYQGFLGERRGDVIQPGYTQTTTAVLTTNANGAPLPYTLATPFANTTILEPVGNSLGKQTALGQAISFFNQNPKVSHQARWQIGFQRELPWGLIAEAEYVGNYGYDIEIVRNINALPNQYLNTDNSRTAAMVSNNTFLTTSVANPFAGLAEFKGTSLFNATVARSQLLRPFPEFGDILTTNNDGKSWYHSGQFSIQKRFTKSFGAQASYTRSKWLQSTEYLNQADPKPTKMISDQDAPNRFSVSGFYALPFGKGQWFLSHANKLVDAALGGWQIEGTYQYQSGFPLGFGSFNIATGATSGDLFYRGGQIAVSNPTVGQWFNQSAFQSFLDWPGFLPSGVTPATATAAQITAAQSAANTAATPVNHLRTLPFRFSNVRTDPINNADLGLRKDIRFNETMKLQLRMEFLNAFNHPLFPGPIVSPGTGVTDQSRNSTFGQISASNQNNYARRAQLGVKFIF